MNYRLLMIALVTSILAAFSTMAVARICHPVTLELSPYVGFDFQVRDMGFKQGYGDNIFAKQYPQGNLFVGLMFNEYIGLELGYEKTLKRSRSSSFSAGDSVLGNIISSGLSGKFQSHGEIYGPNLNIIAMYKLSEDFPLEIFGSIGGAYLTAKFDRNLVEFNNGPPPAGLLRTFDRDKATWRLGAGVQYLLIDCIGLRANIGYENTSQISLYSREALPNPPQIKLKDSLLLGLGLFYVF